MLGLAMLDAAVFTVVSAYDVATAHEMVALLLERIESGG
jgi:hypothetical protein